MSTPTEFDREIAAQEILFENVADLPWAVLLAYMKRMAASDLRRVITVGFVHVDAMLVRVWLGHLRRCLESLPERPAVVDYYDDERRLATAMLLAWKIPEGRRR